MPANNLNSAKKNNAAQASSLLDRLWSSGDYSDLTLSCQGTEFKVHKAIVCPQSPVIATALKGGFTESTTNMVTISEFDVPTVQRMLSFLYEGDYAAGPPSSDPTDALRAHVRVNAIADYCAIPALCQLATAKARELPWRGKAFCAVLRDVAGVMADTSLQDHMAALLGDHLEEVVGPDAFTGSGALDNFTLGVLKRCSSRLQLAERARGRAEESARTSTARAKKSAAEAAHYRGLFEGERNCRDHH